MPAPVSAAFSTRAAGLAQALEQPQLLVGRARTGRLHVIDVTAWVEPYPIAQATEKIGGIAADLPAPRRVVGDTMYLHESYMVRRSVMGLRRKPQLGEIRMLATQRNLDPGEML